MVRKLYDYLHLNNVNVYFPGQHQGECTKSYVLIKDDGIISDNGVVGRGFIDLLFFVPIPMYLECEKYKKQVKGIIKQFGKLKYTGQETGPIVDDGKKAYTFSVLYETYKKLEG